MLSRPINLAIVDDHALFRKTLQNFLSDQRNIRVAIQASDVYELRKKLEEIPIDVLLLDVFLPGLNGSDAVTVIKGEHPRIKILSLSMSRDLDLVSDLLDSGIHGYISKSDEPEELLRAIQSAADNHLFKNDIFTEALYRCRQNDIKLNPQNAMIVLNEREKKLLRLIWEEKSTKEIADELFLGIRSVEKIRQDLKEKLGVKSTVGLLKYAIRMRIVEPVPLLVK